MQVKNQRQAMLLALAAVFFWSTAATAFKLSLQVMTPTQLLAWSSLISMLVLAAFVTHEKCWGEAFSALRARPVYYLAMGALNPCCYYLILFQAYDMLPAQQAQALNYTWALMLSVLAVPLLKQRLTRRDIAALLLGYSGAVIIATRGNLLSLEFDSGLGVLLALASTVLWALYWILNTRSATTPSVSLLLCFLLGTPLVWLVMLLQGEVALPVWQGLLGAVYVGLFEMGLTFMLWLAALRRAEQVSRIGNLIFLSPFLSLIFINLFLGESVVAATWLGLVLIITAVIFQQRGRTGTAGG
ncbi:DMT family transporter [Nitrincola alkalilacustris]|uniref:DMT family transporter n=1 Tax=Nitrincola alkalilacustris TaxID=1571224 RepID=UPI00124C9F87|nr:DMT family transporter [Nitrincola alkalilacustris]